MLFQISLFIFLASVQTALAATAEQWRGRSIYQCVATTVATVLFKTRRDCRIVTDRFALSSGASPNACDPGQQTWCGGNWNS